MIKMTTYLDIQIVSGEDELEQSPLIHLQEVRVPGADVICPLLLVLVILRWGRVILQRYSYKIIILRNHESQFPTRVRT